jgi:hypothetical protein
MKDYILMNKDKLIRTFKWTAIILTTVFCVWTYYKCDSGNCYYSSDFILGLVATLLILPTFSIMFEITQSYIEYRRTEKFFDSDPMTELLKNGFKKDRTEKKSKWFLSKLSAVGQFDNYFMTCEVQNGRLRANQSLLLHSSSKPAYLSVVRTLSVWKTGSQSPR